MERKYERATLKESSRHYPSVTEKQCRETYQDGQLLDANPRPTKCKATGARYKNL